MAKAQQKSLTEQPKVLGEWRGKPIIGKTAKFTKMGDGLSSLVSLDGEIDEQGERVAFVIIVNVGSQTLDLSEDGEYYEYAQKYEGTASVSRVDLAVAQPLVDDTARKITEAEEARAGQAPMAAGDGSAGLDAGTGRRSGNLKTVPDAE